MCGRVAIPYHAGGAVCIVGGDAPLDRRDPAARGAEAVLGFEREASGLAGEDQLQPVCRLFRGTADAAAAREKDERAEIENRIGAGGVRD